MRVEGFLLAMIMLCVKAGAATDASGELTCSCSVRAGKNVGLTVSAAKSAVLPPTSCLLSGGIQAEEYLQLIGGKKEESAETLSRDPEYLMADGTQVAISCLFLMLEEALAVLKQAVGTPVMLPVQLVLNCLICRVALLGRQGRRRWK